MKNTIVTSTFSSARRAGLLLSVGLAWILPGQASAQPSDIPLLHFWIPDGPVQTLLVTNGTTYLGGSFGYIGPDSGSGAVLDLNTVQTLRGFPRIDGTILAAVPDGSGGWFIGGSFTNVGPVIRTNLAHILADNTVDPAWIAHANGPCRSIIRNGSTLYVAGAFTRVGTLTRNRLAAVDTATATVGAWNPNASSTVSTLALDAGNSTLYVGGAFTTVGSSNRNRIAALDLTTGLARIWNPDANSVVASIAVSGTTIYAGGTFTTIGGSPRNRLAALDATSAAGLALAWNPNITGGGVSNLVLHGGTIYAGGSFTSVAGLGRNCLAEIDLTTALPTAWNPAPNTNVNTMLFSGSTLYAGGAFTSIGGVNRAVLAAFDTSTGNLLPLTVFTSDLDRGIPSVVHSLNLAGSQLFVGGTMVSFGGASRRFLAAMDNASGEPTAWNPSPAGTVSALAFATNTVFVGGSFTNIGGQQRNYLAAVDPATGLATTWDASIKGRSGAAVLALKQATNLLYVGGINITNVGGSSRTNLFAVRLSDSVPTAWNPPTLRTTTTGSINTIVTDGDTLLVGGDFTSVAGQLRTNLVAISSTGAGVVESWAPNPNNVIYAVAVASNVVYAGGTFTTIGSVLRNRIAAVDRSTGFGILTWNPDASGTSARVSTLNIEGTVIYVTGQFTSIGGAFRTNATALLLANGQAAAWQPKFSALVRCVALNEKKIFAGGDFFSIAGEPQSYFAGFQAGPEMLAPAVTGGHFGFTIRTGIGSQVVIERTASLSPPAWNPVITNAVTGSPIAFTDPEVAGAFARFYRLFLPASP